MNYTQLISSSKTFVTGKHCIHSVDYAIAKCQPVSQSVSSSVRLSVCLSHTLVLSRNG